VVLPSAVQEAADLHLVADDNEEHQEIVDRHESIAFGLQQGIFHWGIDQGIVFQLSDRTLDLLKDLGRRCFQDVQEIVAGVGEVLLGSRKDQNLVGLVYQELNRNPRIALASFPTAPCSISSSAS